MEDVVVTVVVVAVTGTVIGEAEAVSIVLDAFVPFGATLGRRTQPSGVVIGTQSNSNTMRINFSLR